MIDRTSWKKKSHNETCEQHSKQIKYYTDKALILVASNS